MRGKFKLGRKTKHRNRDEAEEDRVSEEEPAEKEPPSSDTQDTLHETDSEFVPSAAELQSKENNSSCTSESVTCTGTENSDRQALAENSSEGEAASNLEKLIAKQV